ncbi:hypothetical protein RHA1_ro03069 [Rhodococcus jostii RHA1]|uniref:Uncharacterized protein n=1 Tax=Rhodococcus jostii (strain RHA1) TaxID=101510 RepID=Q0SC64_RHOJR|nr:hypothetical protein RHA1_ro03069 [Rhodococcus jostii RHA1]
MGSGLSRDRGGRTRSRSRSPKVGQAGFEARSVRVSPPMAQSSFDTSSIVTQTLAGFAPVASTYAAVSFFNSSRFASADWPGVWVTCNSGIACSLRVFVGERHSTNHFANRDQLIGGNRATAKGNSLEYRLKRLGCNEYDDTRFVCRVT